MVDLNHSNHIKTGGSEYIKSYILYDILERMEYVYEARTKAKNGESCMVTQYVYDGATTKIVKMKELSATWDETWDV